MRCGASASDRGRRPSPLGPAQRASRPAPSDPSWPAAAERHLARLRAGLAPLLPGRGSVEEPAFDHIGSTAVPGLAARPFLDLQVRVPVLPGADALDAALAPLGHLPATGSRPDSPDSPGVHRDAPRGSEVVPERVWAKRLFACPDPAQPVVLHVRLSASPFGRSRPGPGAPSTRPAS
jgi:GrpB-like predicted nucleotidyltransferase (UPF0157 family)